MPTQTLTAPRSHAHVRLVLMVYDEARQGYREMGMSVSRIMVRSDGELDRLWGRLQEIVEDRQWGDRAQPPGVTVPEQ